MVPLLRLFSFDTNFDKFPNYKPVGIKNRNISEGSLLELKCQDQALVHHLDMVAWFLPSFSVFQKTTKPADFLYERIHTINSVYLALYLHMVYLLLSLSIVNNELQFFIRIMFRNPNEFFYINFQTLSYLY